MRDAPPCLPFNDVPGQTADRGVRVERIGHLLCCPIVIHVLATATPPGSSGRCSPSGLAKKL